VVETSVFQAKYLIKEKEDETGEGVYGEVVAVDTFDTGDNSAPSPPNEIEEKEEMSHHKFTNGKIILL
jgi:chitodextrinase